MPKSIFDSFLELSAQNAVVTMISNGPESSPQIYIAIEQLQDDKMRLLEVCPMEPNYPLPFMKSFFSLDEGEAVKAFKSIKPYLQNTASSYLVSYEQSIQLQKYLRSHRKDETEHVHDWVRRCMASIDISPSFYPLSAPVYGVDFCFEFLANVLLITGGGVAVLLAFVCPLPTVVTYGLAGLGGIAAMAGLFGVGPKSLAPDEGDALQHPFEISTYNNREVSTAV